MQWLSNNFSYCQHIPKQTQRQYLTHASLAQSLSHQSSERPHRTIRHGIVGGHTINMNKHSIIWQTSLIIIWIWLILGDRYHLTNFSHHHLSLTDPVKWSTVSFDKLLSSSFEFDWSWEMEFGIIWQTSQHHHLNLTDPVRWSTVSFDKLLSIIIWIWLILWDGVRYHLTNFSASSFEFDWSCEMEYGIIWQTSQHHHLNLTDPVRWSSVSFDKLLSTIIWIWLILWDGVRYHLTNFSASSFEFDWSCEMEYGIIWQTSQHHHLNLTQSPQA